MPTFFYVQFIARDLAEGKLLICSNQRLSSRLLSAFTHYWQQRGQSVVDAPRVYSLESWLQHAWNALLLEAHPLAVSHTVLTKPQEQLLWEQIVLDSGLPLLRPAATAQQAASAYKTLVQWRQNIHDSQVRALFLNDEDSSTFLSWAEEFDRRCSSDGYIPPVKIAEYLLTLYESGEIDRQEPFLLVGFESLSPLETALLQCYFSITINTHCQQCNI
jgi:ATP-dependent helicase/nuclease subunit B